MVAVGWRVGLPTRAVISSMDQPLGYAIGNSLEVKEAISVLRGHHVPDLVELSLTVATLMVGMARPSQPEKEIEHELRELLASGRAAEVFRAWIANQGGDPRQADDPSRLPTAEHVVPVAAASDGWVAGIDARALGELACRLGAGRLQPGAAVDHRVGVVLRRRVGDPVRAGQTLAEIHLATGERHLSEHAHARGYAAFTITGTPTAAVPLVHHVLRSPTDADPRTAPTGTAASEVT
jgi:thymidine phosphorylase